MLSARTSPWVVSIAVLAIIDLLVLLAADVLSSAGRHPWVQATIRSLRAIQDSILWLVSLVDESAPNRRIAAVLRGGVVVGAVVLVLGVLLASGDAVFAQLLTSISLGAAFGHLVLTAVLWFPLAALALLARQAPTADPTADPAADPAVDPAADPAAKAERPRFETEGRAALWSVAVILGAWCVVQIVVVSGGAEAVLAEEGLTAAEYARQGFYQLVAAAAVSLAVLNGAHHLSPTAAGSGRLQRLPAALIGVALGGLIAVTFSRLWFYLDAFGLTMARLSVAAFLCWLAIMTAASVARSLGLGPSRDRLPTIAVLSAGGLALGFAVANPEALVARTNLDRAVASDEIDLDYLTTLSDDAKGTVADFDWDSLGGRPDTITEWLCAEPAWEDHGPLAWNWAYRSSCPY
jgi:hypothetical protein